MGFCYQKNFFNPTLPVDEAQFWALVRATKWNEAIDKFRETGDQKLKRGLPAFIFQATFDETESKKGIVGAWRKQAATRLSGLVVMDIDHIDDPKAVFDSWQGSHGWSRILLVYITPSGKGLKVVFKADPKEGNLIDNQHSMAKILGVKVDESCKDASRMSFICKESDILFINDELFTYENKEFAKKYEPDYRANHSGATKSDNLASKAAVEGAGNVGQVDGEPVSIKWCGYDVQRIIDQRYADKLPCADDSNRHKESLKLATDLLLMLDGDKQTVQKIVEAQPWVQEIIDEWWKRNGGVPQEGERNVKLYQLAVNLRAICDNNKALLLQVMPRLGLDEQELQSIVESACKETPKGISKPMREIIGMNNSVALADDEMARWLWDWGSKIEELAGYFPLIKDICNGLKRNQYVAALFVAGGLLMTLMTRCTYRFYHRPQELRRLNNSTFIIGDPAVGKSFATRLYKQLSAPIVKADEVGKDAINAYREQMRTKGANKEKPKKPKVVVRIHPARTSNAQFIQDMVNAVETVDGQPMQLHMLTFDTELDNTLALQKGGAYIDKQALELKAFHNEEDGQFYANIDSVVQNFSVIWNFIYTGTPLALKKKVNEQNFGTGLATRLTCIPLPECEYEMLDWEESLDLDSDERLKEWAFKLDRMKGELSVKKIVRELYDWTARRMEDAKENDSRADLMLLKRCAYHGLNFSVPFIAMRHWDQLKQDGEFYCGEFETDEVDWRLAELLVNIQYVCQRHFFGAMAEAYFDNKQRDASVNIRRNQKTIEGFNRLPNEFTIDDVSRCFNLNPDPARVKINRLQRDHLVEKIGEIKENGTTKNKFRKIGMISC